MELFNLSAISIRRKKRVGRGGGSGKGMHTTGKGQKGQKTRGKIPTWFEGGQLPLIRRTPFLKGKNRFKSLTENKVVISLDQLSKFKDKDTVDHKSLATVLKIASKRLEWFGAKVVSNGKLTKSLTVKIQTSVSAKKAIEAAGGQVQE